MWRLVALDDLRNALIDLVESGLFAPPVAVFHPSPHALLSRHLFLSTAGIPTRFYRIPHSKDGGPEDYGGGRLLGLALSSSLNKWVLVGRRFLR